MPGILAGNEVPGWVDNSGSINRRILLFEFRNRVENGDMQLGKKLDLEMPAILKKANRAYLEAVALYANDNVWRHLPAEFHRAKEDFSENVNSLVAFLRSGALAFDTKAYMPLGEFATMYRIFVEQNGLVRLKSLAGDALTHPLMCMSCRVLSKATKPYPKSGGPLLSGKFVMGLDVAPTASSSSSYQEGRDDDDPLGN